MSDGADRKWLLGLLAVLAALWFLPVGTPRFDAALLESFQLAKWYTREHVLLCLVPAFFIAGAIGVFVSQASVMRWLGPRAPRPLAYGVASVSGTVLAVCSCTVLPLFGGIYKRGAGLGPASAFLYSGPAINALAIILTARILGFELGAARAVGAVLFSILIGLAMAGIFRAEERSRAAATTTLSIPEPRLSLGRQATFFALLVAILVFANWAPAASGVWAARRSSRCSSAGSALPPGGRSPSPRRPASPPRWCPPTRRFPSPSASRRSSPCWRMTRGSSASGSPPPGDLPGRFCRCCSPAFWPPVSCSAAPGTRG
jgi:hypothetical protein